MDEQRAPKQLLFGVLVKRRLFQGSKKRWRDKVMSDLRALGVTDEWYWLCQDRRLWSELCSTAVSVLAHHRRLTTCVANVFSSLQTFCCDCGWHFWRRGNLTRHHRFCEAITSSLVQE